MINSSKANEDLYSGYNEFNPLLDTKVYFELSFFSFCMTQNSKFKKLQFKYFAKNNETTNQNRLLLVIQVTRLIH